MADRVIEGLSSGRKQMKEPSPNSRTECEYPSPVLDHGRKRGASASFPAEHSAVCYLCEEPKNLGRILQYRDFFLCSDCLERIDNLRSIIINVCSLATSVGLPRARFPCPTSGLYCNWMREGSPRLVDNRKFQVGGNAHGVNQDC